MRSFLLVLLAATSSAHAQKVYKCDGPTGPVYQGSPCEPGAVPHQTQRDSNFGGSSRSAEVSVTGEACVASLGATYANGYLVNHTPEAKTVRVKATFTRRGRVIDTITLPYQVPGFDRTAFSLIGSEQTSCELNWVWD